MADISQVEGVEIYRRPAEIPVEYSQVVGGNCGVLVVWTKNGPAAGRPGSGSYVGDYGDDASEVLPEVGRAGPAPTEGEDVRIQLSPNTASALGIPTTWAGTFVKADESEFVATDALVGRTIAVPTQDLSALQVRRARPQKYAWMRGVGAGAALGAGTYLGLSLLCAWSGCNGAVEQPWLPAAIVGSFVGVLVYRRGPGTEWVEAPIPGRPPERGLRPH